MENKRIELNVRIWNTNELEFVLTTLLFGVFPEHPKNETTFYDAHNVYSQTEYDRLSSAWDEIFHLLEGGQPAQIILESVKPELRKELKKQLLRNLHFVHSALQKHKQSVHYPDALLDSLSIPVSEIFKMNNMEYEE